MEKGERRAVFFSFEEKGKSYIPKRKEGGELSILSWGEKETTYAESVLEGGRGVGTGSSKTKQEEKRRLSGRS